MNFPEVLLVTEQLVYYRESYRGGERSYGGYGIVSMASRNYLARCESMLKIEHPSTLKAGTVACYVNDNVLCNSRNP